MSNFLIDKQFSELYESYFANILNMTWNKTNCDDFGVDIMNVDNNIYIDVKCYASPLYIKHFKGVFLETYLPKSNKDGWLFDKNKQTTHYILLQDCDRNKIEFYKGWLIKKQDLLNALNDAIKNGDVEMKSIASAKGYMLPYKYLNKYSIYKFDGEKCDKELTENVA